METKPQSDLNPEENNFAQEQNSNPSTEMAENITSLPVEEPENAPSEESTENVDHAELPAEVSAEADDQIIAAEAAEPEVEETTEVSEPVAEEAPESVADEVSKPEAVETPDPVAEEAPETTEESAEPVANEVPETDTEVSPEENTGAEVTLPDATPEPETTEVVEPVAEVIPDENIEAEVSLPEVAVESETKDEDKAPVAIAEEATEPKAELSFVLDKTLLLPLEALSDLDASDEDDEDSEEEGEEDSETDLGELTREELVAKLEELVNDEDVLKIKDDVARVKVAFLKLNKEFKHEAYQKMVAEADEAEGEDAPAKEAVVVADDEVEEKFKAAFQIYKQNKARFNEQQEKLKTENLEAKNRILEELKALISSEETLKKTYDEFKVLQEQWKAIGMVPKAEVNNLWQNYHFLVEKFFDKVKINKELKDLDMRKNLEAKMELCGKAEELLLETSIIKSFKQLQQYHEEWKEIGPVPQDKKDELWDRFRSATEKINDRRREYYNEMQEAFEQNLAAKTILCETAEQVIGGEYNSIKTWQQGTSQITELLQIWKTLGPAPKKQNNEIWNRFKTSLDTFFNAKKEFYNKLKDQQMHNYNLKLDLCVQAEALRASTDWKNTTRELINMQKEWKDVGPVPRKQSDKVWKRFRSACDEFFQAKSAYFKNVSGHEEENMKLKLELIEKAKAFEVGENRNEAVETLKDFQQQWMGIGHVPIKEKDRLQTEFRALINKHFETLKMESISMGASNYRNRVDRMTKDSPDAGRIVSKERTFVQGKIQQLQDEIKTWENNIGFFAKSKTANLLKQEFEKKIDKAKEELQLMEEKLKMLRESNE